MNHNGIILQADSNRKRAHEVLRASRIAEIWEAAGCRVNIVGSLKMGLLAKHRDIDLHVYSKGISEKSSFVIADGVMTIEDLKEWVDRRRSKPAYYWIP